MLSPALSLIHILAEFKSYNKTSLQTLKMVFELNNSGKGLLEPFRKSP